MHQYIVQQKIKTVSDLCVIDSGNPVAMTIENIEFNQWDFSIAEGCIGDAWIAKGTEEAENFHDAVANFRKKLNKIIPRVAFVSQCYMDFSQESFMVTRCDDNPSLVTYVYYTTRHGAPGLMFMNKEKGDFDKIKLENDEFFWYMTDCYNTVGYTAKLLLMFAALESLSGKEVKTSEDGTEYETYNRENMKSILGADLFNDIYGKGGLRHKLTHGEYINPSFSGTNYVEILHNLILDYFNKNFSTKLNTNVVNPQRHPFGGAYYQKLFIKPKEGCELNLTIKIIDEEMDLTGKGVNQSLASFDNDTDYNFQKNY